MKRIPLLTLAIWVALSVHDIALAADVLPLKVIAAQGAKNIQTENSLDAVVEAVRQTTLSAQVAGAVVALHVKAGDRVAVVPGERVLRSYDNRNRLVLVDYPDSTPDVSTTYTASGMVQTIARSPTLLTYAYNKRGLLSSERLEYGSIDWLTGADLTEDIWDQFFAFYMDTGSRKWGSPYLTRAAFDLLGERMGEQIVLVIAFDGDRPVAGAPC